MDNGHNQRIINIMKTRFKWLNQKKRYNLLIIILLAFIYVVFMGLLKIKTG